MPHSQAGLLPGLGVRPQAAVSLRILPFCARMAAIMSSIRSSWQFMIAPSISEARAPFAR